MTTFGGVEPPGEGNIGGSSGGTELLEFIEGDEVAKHLNRRLGAAAELCRDRWLNAQENHRFVSPTPGAQWSQREWQDRQQDGRPTWTINDVALAVHALAGQEITGRFRRNFKGRGDDNSPMVAEALNVIDAAVRELARAEHVESEAFRNLLIDGYSWVEWYQDYVVDFRGRTLVRAYELWDIMWDVTARESMLVDREWDAAGSWVSMDAFLAMHPDKRDDLKSYINRTDGWVRDEDLGETARWPWLYRATRGRYVAPRRRELFLVDYQWRQRIPRWAVEMPVLAGGQPQEDPDAPGTPLTKLTLMGEDEFRQYADQQKYATGQTPDFVGPDDGLYGWRYSRSTMLGEKEIKRFEQDYGQFSRTCMTGFPYRQMEMATFHGAVDYAKDPQRFKNAVVSLVTSMLQRQAKGGVIVDPSGFERPEQLATDLSQPYPILRTKLGALKGGAESLMHELSVAPFPSGIAEFLNMADMAVWRPLGLNPDVLGQVKDMRRITSGVYNSVAEAGQTVMAYLFNSLKAYRQDSGRLCLAMYREHSDEKRLRELAGPKYAAFIPPKAEWETFFERAVIVDETSAQTKDQRMEVWDLLSRQGEGMKLLDSGLMPPEIYAELFPGVTEPQREMWKEFLGQKKAVTDLQTQVQEMTLQVQMMQLQQQLAAPQQPDPAAQGGDQQQSGQEGGGQPPAQ